MSSESPESNPIACTLSSPDLQARLEWITRLNADALREQHRSDLQLEFIYSSDAAERVREMVERERQCCAFLKFTLQESRDSVAVTIEVPGEAARSRRLYLNPFWPGASPFSGVRRRWVMDSLRWMEMQLFVR